MQRLNFGGGRLRELRLGLLGAFAVVAALVAAGVVYLLPIGKSTYAAELTEAQSIQVGDQVRVFGVQVGTVTSLGLQPDHVDMKFTVDRSVFIGDHTTLEVRMLTVVGGHYLAVIPSGTTPLGSTPISGDRVRLPYSLVQVLQDAARPVAAVEGETLRDTFAAAQTSLNSSPDAARRIGHALETFVNVLNRQNADVSRALALTDEYLSSIEANKSLLHTFIDKFGQLETRALDKRAEISAALKVTAQILERIAAVEPTWHDVLKPLVVELAKSIPALEEAGRRMDGIIRTIEDIGSRLQGMTSPAAGVTLSPTLCIPVPGRSC